MTHHLADVNVWLALVLEEHVFHGRARGWPETLGGRDTIYFCRSTQQALLRLLTQQRVLGAVGLPPLSGREAWAVYRGLREDDRFGFADEPNGIDAAWEKFSRVETASPTLWMDAYLAAFARAGGYRLVTTDRGFRQFEGLDCLVL